MAERHFEMMTANMAVDADVPAARCRVPMVRRSLLRYEAWR